MVAARFRSPLWAALGAASLVLASGTARADGAPKFNSGWWLPVGLSLGGAFRSELPDGFFIGGEASGVYLWTDDGPGGMWLGAMADAVYDFGTEAFRHRIGPEIGWWFLGAEVAYLGEARGGEYRPGISVRASGNVLGILNLYGGYGRTYGSDGASSYGEFGGLLKFPIPLTATTRPKYEPLPEPLPPYQPGEPLQSLPPGTPPPPPGQPPGQPWPPGPPPGPRQPPGQPPGPPYVQAPPGPYATPPPPPPPPG